VWTAECYLLFAVGHRDVFPAGDLALRVGWQEIAGLEAAPSEKTLRYVAEQWAPRRTAAAHLIWDAYLRERGRR
jgi:DNA-3-methyladenine glycosylase II